DQPRGRRPPHTAEEIRALRRAGPDERALGQLGQARDAALQVAPVYIAFALLAPFAGWLVARLFRLAQPAARAVAFSGATRNSLVVLPLALAVPGALPLLPAIIVTQTLVELVAELVYVRAIARLGSSPAYRASASITSDACLAGLQLRASRQSRAAPSTTTCQ
ncbi:MAG: hypothetical protein ABW220_01785, partial [Burkholderiaceae bacterium]